MNRGVIELQQNVWGRSVCQHYEHSLVVEEIRVTERHSEDACSGHEIMRVWTIREVEMERIY